MSDPIETKKLKRQYLDAPTRAGVFVIRNLVEGHVYVAASMNAEGAINRHRFELKLRTHRNRRLLHDWIAHGSEQFAFELLDRVKPRDDPAFDVAAELEALLSLWREELRCDESPYHAVAATGSPR